MFWNCSQSRIGKTVNDLLDFGFIHLMKRPPGAMATFIIDPHWVFSGGFDERLQAEREINGGTCGSTPDDANCREDQP